MQFENLPLEVIQQVFLNLEKDNKDTWFEFGAPIFYKHIQLSRKMPGFLRIDLGLECNIQLRYCRYTKTFTIRDDTLYGAQNQTFINSLEPDQLLYLLQHMPNLKKISFADSDNLHHYMTILRDAPDNLQLLKHVEQINVQSAYKLYWEREIMFRDENEDYDLYFAVYYKFRETLTHLVVHFYHNDLAPQYDLGILGLTGRFSNLTHLQFYHTWADDFTLFEILTTLPHLESLKIVSDFMNLEEAQRGLNEFRQIFKDHEKAVANVKNLRTLYVAVPSFDGAYIDYIVNHCPVNLEDLQIEMMDNDFYNWVQDNTMEKVLKLAKRLSLIKTIRIFTNPYVGG